VSDLRLPDLLEHMQQAAADAMDFTEGMGQDDFLADKRTQQAVIMSLIVLGEAAHPELENRKDQQPGGLTM